MERKTSFTDVVRPENVRKDLIKCCEAFSNTSSFLVGSKSVPVNIWNTPDLVKYICKNEANKAILRNVFQNICNYEKKYTGISKLVLFLLSQENLDYTGSSRIRTNSRSLINFAVDQIDCQTTKEIFGTIKQYGNPQLSVSVQRTPNDRPIIKFVSNPSVRLRVHPKFTMHQGETKNNKFLMINGAASKSSELMKLMNLSFENKDTTYFLVCRSFNDDVLFMIKENYDRSITNVIPVEFGFDVDSINSLSDLVSVVGGLPLSSELGDAVSSFDIGRLGYSERVKFSGDLFTIVPSKNNTNHVKKLLKSIEDSEDAKRQLLSKRMINLRGNSCNIFLPMQSKYDQVEINIRHATKIFTEMCRQGVQSMVVGKKKFYVPDYSDTIIRSLIEDIENLMKTEVYLPRRNRT